MSFYLESFSLRSTLAADGRFLQPRSKTSVQSQMRNANLALVLLATAAVLSSSPAFAYVGPGLGAGTIGVIIGIAASAALAIFAIVWYPVKRMLKKNRKPSDESKQDREAQREQPKD